MKRMKLLDLNVAVLGLAILMIGLLAPASAWAVEYRFTKIVDGIGPVMTLSPFASMNNAGMVAFSGSDALGIKGVFVGDGGPLTTIADETGMFKTFGASPSINDSRSVAFQATTDNNSQAIFIGSTDTPTNTVTRLVDNSGSFSGFSIGLDVVINQGDEIAFRATLDGGGEGIFTANTQTPLNTVTTIADSIGPSFLTTSQPAINNNGQVIFRGNLDDGRQGIYVGLVDAPRNDVTAIADSNGPFRFLINPTMNDAGTVAFQGTLKDDAGVGIYLGSVNTPANEVDLLFEIGSGGRFKEVDSLVIGNTGAVVFNADTSNRHEGLFVANPDGTIETVLVTGALLNGSTVESITLPRRNSFNDAGQILFRAKLGNNRAGLFRADPIVIPEPGTFAVFTGLIIPMLLIHKTTASGRATRRASSDPRGCDAIGNTGCVVTRNLGCRRGGVWLSSP